MDDSQENNFLKARQGPQNKEGPNTHSRSTSGNCYLCDTVLLDKKLASSLARALSRRYDFSVMLYYRHLMDRVVSDWKEMRDYTGASNSLTANGSLLKRFSLRESLTSLADSKTQSCSAFPRLLHASKAMKDWNKAKKKLLGGQAIKISMQNQPIKQ